MPDNPFGMHQFVADTRRYARILWGACDALDEPRALGPVHEIAAQTSVLDGRATPADDSRDWLFRSPAAIPSSYPRPSPARQNAFRRLFAMRSWPQCTAACTNV